MPPLAAYSHGRTSRDVTGRPIPEDLLRDLAPQVLGALLRRYGQLKACEDAASEAMIAAATSRPPEVGLPTNAERFPWSCRAARPSDVEGHRDGTVEANTSLRRQ